MIADILGSVLRRRQYTLQALWEYRKWFLKLSEEQLEKDPALICGLVQMLLLQGDLDRAYKFLGKIPDRSIYWYMTKMTLPGIGNDELRSIVEELKGQGFRRPGLTLTAGRPSVLNGMWDVTPQSARLLENKEDTLELIETLYGEQAQSIYEVALAEKLYWEDDCYTALVHVVGIIPFLREKKDMRLLFVALTIEMYILVLNGQATTVEPLIKNLRQQIKEVGLEAYLPNIDALEAWAAMYDGHYAQVTKWMREAAPDEYSKFCMLDLFRYMVKMRAYIIHGKYLMVTALANRLLPLLEAGKRYMNTCELHVIWAMSDYADGRKEEAFGHIEKALALSEQYRYDRLLADEGPRALEVLKQYQKAKGLKGKQPYLDKVIAMAEKVAAIHPSYLKSQLPKQPALTETEMRVLRLLADFRTNGEIAEITGMAEETARKHCKHIFAKLEVKNRHQAVDKAIEYGLIEPKKITNYNNTG